MTDTLPRSVLPSLKQSGNPPEWVSKRGGDCRAYDRRQERHVYGPSHPFQKTTDLQVENGLLRFWVGPSNMPAFLNVEAFRTGIWRHRGYLRLADSRNLLGARLVRVTPDACTVRLDIEGEGPQFVTLRRGERGVRGTLGDEIGPTVSTSRTWRWQGTPPSVELSGVSKESPGLFDAGLRADYGRARFVWPDVSVDAWSVLVVWLPYGGNSGDGTGELDNWGDSTWGTGEWGGQFGLNDARLLTIEDSTGEVGNVTYDEAAKRIEFNLGGEALLSGAISFDAREPIRVLVRFSTEEGMALSVKVDDGAIAHYADTSAVDPGTAEDTYTVLGIGPSDLNQMGGRFDQLGIFEDWTTNAEASALLSQDGRTSGLPGPEGRLVWFAPFDADPTTAASADSFGLSVRMTPSLSLTESASGVTSELGAFVLTGESGDTASDVLEQFYADSLQEVVIR